MTLVFFYLPYNKDQSEWRGSINKTGKNGEREQYNIRSHEIKFLDSQYSTYLSMKSKIVYYDIYAHFHMGRYLLLGNYILKYTISTKNKLKNGI